MKQARDPQQKTKRPHKDGSPNRNSTMHKYFKEEKWRNIDLALVPQNQFRNVKVPEPKLKNSKKSYNFHLRPRRTALTMITPRTEGGSGFGHRADGDIQLCRVGAEKEITSSQLQRRRGVTISRMSNLSRPNDHLSPSQLKNREQRRKARKSISFDRELQHRGLMVGPEDTTDNQTKIDRHLLQVRQNRDRTEQALGFEVDQIDTMALNSGAIQSPITGATKRKISEDPTSPKSGSKQPQQVLKVANLRWQQQASDIYNAMVIPFSNDEQPQTLDSLESLPFNRLKSTFTNNLQKGELKDLRDNIYKSNIQTGTFDKRNRELRFGIEKPHDTMKIIEQQRDLSLESSPQLNASQDSHDAEKRSQMHKKRREDTGSDQQHHKSASSEKEAGAIQIQGVSVTVRSSSRVEHPEIVTSGRAASKVVGCQRTTIAGGLNTKALEGAESNRLSGSERQESHDKNESCATMRETSNAYNSRRDSDAVCQESKHQRSQSSMRELEQPLLMAKALHHQKAPNFISPSSGCSHLQQFNRQQHSKNVHELGQIADAQIKSASSKFIELNNNDVQYVLQSDRFEQNMFLDENEFALPIQDFRLPHSSELAKRCNMRLGQNQNVRLAPLDQQRLASLKADKNQTVNLKLFQKRMGTLRDPGLTLRKIAEGQDASSDLGMVTMPSRSHNLRSINTVLSKKRVPQPSDKSRHNRRAIDNRKVASPLLQRREQKLENRADSCQSDSAKREKIQIIDDAGPQTASSLMRSTGHQQSPRAGDFVAALHREINPASTAYQGAHRAGSRIQSQYSRREGASMLQSKNGSPPKEFDTLRHGTQPHPSSFNVKVGKRAAAMSRQVPIARGFKSPAPEPSVVLTYEKRERPLNARQLSVLPTRAQRLFAQLDEDFERVFVDHHGSKLSARKDHLQVALMAKLKRDRITMFRQYVAEEKSRKLSFSERSAVIKQVASVVPPMLRNSYANGPHSSLGAASAAPEQAASDDSQLNRQYMEPH